MNRPHIPNLDIIRALPNTEVKFYAIVGAAISLTAALELAFYDIFEKATGLARPMAGKIFYGTTALAARRDIAFAVMDLRLAGREDATEWAKLKIRMLTATGKSADRHLVAHNIVYAFERSGMSFGGIAFNNNPSPPVPTHEFWVTQDQVQVDVGARKPDKTNFGSLLIFCQEGATLLADLDAFLSNV